MRRRTIFLGIALAAVASALLVWSTRDGASPDATRPVGPTHAAQVAPPPAPTLAGRPPTAAPPPSDSDRQSAGEGAPREEADPLIGRSFVEGRVVDPDGRPLAGIPVYVALADPKGYERADQRILFAGGPDSDGGRAEARGYGGHDVTDATGAFRVDAYFTRVISSGDGGVRVVPCHPAWLEPKVASGVEGGVIQVDRAACLAVRVEDEAGAPVPELYAVVQESARHGDQGLAATHGGFVVQWRRRADLPARVDATVIAWALGRRIEQRRVTILAERGSDSITIDLGPVRPDAKIVLRPDSSTDALRARTVIYLLSLPERRDDEILRVRATWDPTEGGGAFVASLPPGRFRVRSFAWDESVEGPVADETVDLSSGRTIERTWATFGWGTARSRH